MWLQAGGKAGQVDGDDPGRVETDYAESGSLMCYWAEDIELSRRVASYVDRILKGANPATLPIEQPTKYELVVNLKTAKALALTIPASLLVRATVLR